VCPWVRAFECCSRLQSYHPLVVSCRLVFVKLCLVQQQPPNTTSRRGELSRCLSAMNEERVAIAPNTLFVGPTLLITVRPFLLSGGTHSPQSERGSPTPPKAARFPPSLVPHKRGLLGEGAACPLDDHARSVVACA